MGATVFGHPVLHILFWYPVIAVTNLTCNSISAARVPTNFAERIGECIIIIIILLTS